MAVPRSWRGLSRELSLSADGDARIYRQYTGFIPSKGIDVELADLRISAAICAAARTIATASCLTAGTSRDAPNSREILGTR
jgi:hypothetical protein